MKRVYQILLKHSVGIFCVILRRLCDLSYMHVVLCPSSRQILATGGKSGPALGGTEYRLMPSACRLIVRAKL